MRACARTHTRSVAGRKQTAMFATLKTRGLLSQTYAGPQLPELCRASPSESLVGEALVRHRKKGLWNQESAINVTVAGFIHGHASPQPATRQYTVCMGCKARK